MNNYVKPVIKLATFAPGGSAVSCGTTESDMSLIQGIIGGADASKTFGMGEPCEIQIPLDMYCKFTSSEMGAIVVFWS